MAEIYDNSKKVKVIAFYLPQFHAIPENDAVWGKGFTEWTNVKKAVSLFQGHYQPRIPLNKNYYNLLNLDTLKWQADLAQRYDVFGFCYYHYWFKGGKQLLEKPAELMLKDKRISQPFCFCWANENWSKRWDGGNREVFVEQEYGTKEDWEKHFQYLLKFFCDPRYITMNGCPILIIYRAEQIPSLNNMIDFFRNRAKQSGFPGLVIMFQHPAYARSKRYNENLFDYYIHFEPAYSIRKVAEKQGKKKTIKEYVKDILGAELTRKIAMVHGKIRSDNKDEKFLQKIDYDEIWHSILEEPYDDHKHILGAFTDWDNTPRNKKGMMFVGTSPEKFSRNFAKLVNKVVLIQSPNIIFINAWNEWGEGAYLEPDQKNGYAYLEAIKDAINH